MLQAGPVGESLIVLLCLDALTELCCLLSLTVNVHLPKDRISMAHQGYGFCEFLTEEDAEYACKIMNQIKLWGKPIRVNKVRCRFYMTFRNLWDESLALDHSLSSVKTLLLKMTRS